VELEFKTIESGRFESMFPDRARFLINVSRWDGQNNTFATISARTGLMQCSKRLTGLVVHSIISSARTSSVERILSFAVLQTNARADPLFDLDQG
jgi:hypothetical protein